MPNTLPGGVYGQTLVNCLNQGGAQNMSSNSRHDMSCSASWTSYSLCMEAVLLLRQSAGQTGACAGGAKHVGTVISEAHQGNRFKLHT